MIKKIINALKSNSCVSDYLINENKEKSHQAFFVLGKLETTRLVEVTEYEITVYVRHDGKIGYSSFIISHNLSKAELDEKISEAVKASMFVFNKDFSLVEGTKKKSVKDKEFGDSFDDMMNKIDSIMKKITKPNMKFNAVELFYNETTKHVVNSKGVNLSRTNYNLEIETKDDIKSAKKYLKEYIEKFHLSLKDQPYMGKANRAILASKKGN